MYALLVVVGGELLIGVTLIAVAVVVLVLTVLDEVNADLVVVLDLIRVADLVAHTTGCALRFAVEYWRAAQVIDDFHLGCHAVQALVFAALVLAVRDGFDAHVFVLGKVVPVDALETLAITVVVATIGDFLNAFRVISAG